MEFLFDRRMFDTNKTVFVLGYVLKKTWFPVESDRDMEMAKMYEPVIKKCRIEALRFGNVKDCETGKNHNMVTSIEIDSFHANPYISNVVLRGNHIFGRSTKECMQIFNERKSEPGL